MISHGDEIRASVARLRDLEDGPRAWPKVVALGEAALPLLEELLQGRSESVAQPRRLAAAAIGAIGGSEARAVLRRALRDALDRELDPVLRLAEDEVVGEIAQALARAGRSEDAAIIVEALERRPNAACARALGDLGAAEAAPALARCLSDATVQDAAGDALLRIGAAAAPCLTTVALCPALRGTYEGATSVRTRVRALQLLGQIGSAATDLPLAVALSDAERDVRFAAALALARRGAADAAAALPVLREALADQRWLVAQEAEAALAAAAGSGLLGQIASLHADRGAT